MHMSLPLILSDGKKPSRPAMALSLGKRFPIYKLPGMVNPTFIVGQVP